MAFYKDIVVSVEQVKPEVKIAPVQFLFAGQDLDLGEGMVSISSIGKKDGSVFTLKNDCPQGNINVPISQIIGGTYAGIRGDQVLAALSALADQLYEAAE
jgi:hypothetical protein